VKKGGHYQPPAQELSSGQAQYLLATFIRSIFWVHSRNGGHRVDRPAPFQAQCHHRSTRYIYAQLRRYLPAASLSDRES
jgi:hypothetical protein